MTVEESVAVSRAATADVMTITLRLRRIFSERPPVAAADAHGDARVFSLLR